MKSKTNTPNNLIETWLTSSLADSAASAAQCLRDFNEELGTSYSYNRFSEWRRGERSIPEKVQHHMLRASLLHALRETLGDEVAAKATPRKLEKLIEMITPPERVEP